MFDQNFQHALSDSLVADTSSKIKNQGDTKELKNTLNRILTRPSGINKMIGTLVLL